MALNTGDPKFQRAILIVLVIAAVGYGYFAYIFGPRQENVKMVEAELSRVEQSLATARAVALSVDTLLLSDELSRREGELALAEQLIPEKENLAKLLETITTIGGEDGVDFTLVEPKAPVQHEIYQERPFAVTLRGGFHQTARFLADVAGLPQVVKPVKLSIVRDTRQDATPAETVTAQLTLTTYLMIAAPPKKPEPAKPEVKKAVKKK